MTDMQQYVVEEWAEDYRAGRLGRREFLRRMTIMAGGAALAIPPLSALGLAATPAGVKAAAARHPAVLVIHENRGLLEHFKDISRRFAKAGFVGMAVDLASHEGGTERFSDSAQVSSILARTAPERHVETMNAAVRHLQGLAGVRRDRVGAMGFCFGGGMVWRLATANADLRAAAPFYGSNPPM